MDTKMKRKIFAAAAVCMMGLPAASMAMDPATLLSDPARYRPVYAEGDQTIYADVETLRSMQSRDFPGSIENISVTLYVESYVADPDAMDFEEGHLVSSIDEYSAVVHGNKREGVYTLQKKLTASYDGQGKETDRSARGHHFEAEAEDMYYTLVRTAHLR